MIRVINVLTGSVELKETHFTRRTVHYRSFNHVWLWKFRRHFPPKFATSTIAWNCRYQATRSIMSGKGDRGRKRGRERGNTRGYHARISRDAMIFADCSQTRSGLRKFEVQRSRKGHGRCFACNIWISKRDVFLGYWKSSDGQSRRRIDECTQWCSRCQQRARRLERTRQSCEKGAFRSRGYERGLREILDSCKERREGW